MPLLGLGLVALLTGVGAGLARVGWSMPPPLATTAEFHGPLMIGGFLGVVIALERAVAIGRVWSHLGPLLAGLGGIGAVAGNHAAAATLLLAGSVVLLVASVDVFLRQRRIFTITLAFGAACWAIGNALWLLGSPVHESVGWWLGFLILTIAAERLELSRFLPASSGATALFVLIVAALVLGLVSARLAWGISLFGGALIALALWLLKQDVARRTVRNVGITRFIAVCLLSGYAWLAIGGSIIVGARGLAAGTAAYDAAIHALALGFVFSMIFAHAPIIVPAVLRVSVRYGRAFYAPLTLLHVSLALRLAGDASERFAWVRVGALLNALAIVAFIAVITRAVARRRSPRP